MSEIKYNINGKNITIPDGLSIEELAKITGDNGLLTPMTTTQGKDFSIFAAWNVQGDGLVQICIIPKDGVSQWAKPVHIDQAKEYIEKLKQHFEGVNT